METKKWSEETKLSIVLEGLKGRSMTEICQEYQVSQTLYYKWRDRFLEGGKKALSYGLNNPDKKFQSEVMKLQNIIGRQAVQIDILKKTENLE
jgi:transposase-like protein